MEESDTPQPDPDSEQARANRRLMTTLLWSVFVVSPVALGAMVYAVTRQGTPPAEGLFSVHARMALAAICAFLVVLSYVIPNKMLEKRRTEHREKQTQQTPWDFTLTFWAIRWSLLETIATLGSVIGFMDQSFAKGVPFIAVAFLLVLSAYPKEV